MQLTRDGGEPTATGGGGQAREPTATGDGGQAGGEQDVVTRLLGRVPQSAYEVVVRDACGSPVVIRNAPFMFDGTPMPTRFWLVGAAERLMVDRLEAAGGVRQAEASVDPLALEEAHRRYATERDGAIPREWVGPRPAGGVGGTRQGVKCLHAHYAWHLAGGDDPVGRWVDTEADHTEADHHRA